MTLLRCPAPSLGPGEAPDTPGSSTTLQAPEPDPHPSSSRAAEPHGLAAHPAAPSPAHASKAPRQPLRVLHKAGRKGHVAEPLPGHPGVPDVQEHNAAATRSHELSLMRLPSTFDVPWHERHTPLQVERCAAVRTDMRWNDTSTRDEG